LKKEIPVNRGKKYTIDIVSMGHSCEGVGKYEDFTVFVPYALIGETVEVVITEVKKSYAKGNIKKIITASPQRVAAKCAIYDACGGCQIQHIDYQGQLDIKHQQVVDALKHIGKQSEILIHPTLGAENPWNYRNKMQFPIGKKDEKVIVGCFAQGSHTIVDTKNCLIQDEANNKIANVVRDIIKELDISVYDETLQKGVLRHVVGRVGIASGEVMVVLVITTKVLPKADQFVKLLEKRIPNLVSVMQNSNPNDTNVILGEQTKKLWGKATITDKIGDFDFMISARSFFQVNTKQAEVLYNKTLEYAKLTGVETVLDAYCGTGTITLFLAKHAKKVIGIEIVAQAIRDANKNAKNNNIDNVKFIVGDATVLMPDLHKRGVTPDVIVVDPPRVGCEQNVLEIFARMNPDRIVYVSCNPASLARDVAILDELGYKAVEVQPVDMFAQTSHVETITLLQRHTT